jgi:uncharacterized membrane protein
MEEILHEAARFIALCLEGLALVAVVIGAVEATIGIIRHIRITHIGNAAKRAVWLEFARWLVAALTFQLAADVVNTTIAPTWDDIGRVAAIAAIRTFLTFFLDRDIDTIRLRQHETSSVGGEAAGAAAAASVGERRGDR